MSGHFELICDDHGRGRVVLDGVEVHNVTDVAIKVRVKETNEVVLKIIPSKVSVSGVFDVTSIEDEVRRFDLGEGQAEPDA